MEATQTLVKDLYSSDVVTIDSSSTIQEALDLFLENRLHAVPVVAPNGKCVGMLALVDLLELASESEHLLEAAGDDPVARYHAADQATESLGTERIEAVMSDSVIGIDPSATVKQAAKMMLEQKIHHLPVIDTQQQLLGIISTMDVLRATVSAESE